MNSSPSEKIIGLTEKQLEMLNYLHSYKRQNNNKMPRLKEITEHFGVTNKAVLDVLAGLRKKGRIQMEGDVQSISLIPGKDVFISYSSKDQSVARRIADAFRTVGYQVWMDEIDVLTGEDIVDKVFQGIMECKFFVVLISEQSLKSRWVKEEISTARLREIEGERVIVMPVVISDTAEPPPPLKTKKYVRLSEDNFNDGMRTLMEHLAFLSFRESLPTSTSVPFEVSVEEYQALVQKDLTKFKWPVEVAYKQWEIYPMPPATKLIDKDKIEEFVDAQRVKLRGYGGMGFPHETRYHEIQKSVVKDGFHMYWSSAPDGMFHEYHVYDYWRMFENGYLFTRKSLYEDAISEQLKSMRVLSLEWIEMDIARPLIWIRNLLEALPAEAYRFELKLMGMEGRRLHILNKRRSGFDWEYKSSEDEITLSATIDKDIDLLETALEMTLEVIKYFNWSRPNISVIKTDLETMLSGQFPD